MGGNGEEGARLLSSPHWQDKRQWAQMEIQIIHKKKHWVCLGFWFFLMVRVVKNWHRLSKERRWILHPWGCSKPIQMWSSTACCSWLCLNRVVRLDNLQRSFPSSAIPWYTPKQSDDSKLLSVSSQNELLLQTRLRHSDFEVWFSIYFELWYQTNFRYRVIFIPEIGKCSFVHLWKKSGTGKKSVTEEQETELTSRVSLSGSRDKAEWFWCIDYERS